MILFHNLLYHVVLLLCVLSTRAYTSRMEGRGYNPPPGVEQDVDAREKAKDPGRYEVDEARVEGRGFNDAPAEDNVSGLDCMLNEDGAFGTVTSDITPELIEFKYQLETKPNPQASLEEILDDLEKAYLEKVLPLLFADICSRRERRRHLRRKLEIVGATTNPEDGDLQGELSFVAPLLSVALNNLTHLFFLYCHVDTVQCTPENSTDLCYQIEGQMHIFTNGTALPDLLKKDILDELERSMNDGEFDEGVHEDVTKVTYIVMTFDGIQAGTPTTGQSGTPQSRLSGPIYAVIAVGGLMLITAGVVWKRRRDSADAASELTADTSTLQGAPSAGTQEAREVKPEGDLTGIAETTLDFSTIQEEQ